MDYYGILDVDESSTQSEIKSKFLQKIKTVHPDKTQQSTNEITDQLIQAYKVLGNVSNRKIYDEYQKQKDKNIFNKIELNIKEQCAGITFECEQCGDENLVPFNMLTQCVIECRSCNLKLEVTFL